MDQKTFGKFLFERRTSLHLSQSFLADKLGYSKQIISNWERGLSYPNMICWDELLTLLKIDINGFINCKNECNITGYEFDEKKFVFHLKDLRIKEGLTQIDLAHKVGTNNKTISSWENGTSLPSLDNFITLSDVLKVEYPELFYGEKIEIQEEKDSKEKLKVKKPKFNFWKKLAIYVPTSIAAVALIVPIINRVAASNVAPVSQLNVVETPINESSTNIEEPTTNSGSENSQNEEPNNQETTPTNPIDNNENNPIDNSGGNDNNQSETPANPEDNNENPVDNNNQIDNNDPTNPNTGSEDPGNNNEEPTNPNTGSEDPGNNNEEPTNPNSSSEDPVDNNDDNDEPIPVINYSVNIEEDSVKVYVGDTYQIPFTYYPTTVQVKWTSSNSNIASVDSNGLVTFNVPGTAFVTGYLKNHTEYYDTIEVLVMNRAYIEEESIAPIDSEMYSKVNKTDDVISVSYYFEDKKTVLYEESFNSADDFVITSKVPTFGPLLGYQYNFLGWDFDGDGVEDDNPNPSSIMKAVAVYQKEATSEKDFIFLNSGNNATFYLQKDVETVIVPSRTYLDSLTRSDLYDVTHNALYGANRIGNATDLIYMEGISLALFNSGDNLKYVSFPSSATNVNGLFPYVEVRGGYIHGSINGSAFANGVSNEYLIIDTSGIDKNITIGSYAFKGSNNLEYIKFFTDGSGYLPTLSSNSFSGCPSLKMVDTYDEKFFGHPSYLPDDAYLDTNLDYVDLRLFNCYKLAKPIVTASEGPITLVIPNVDTDKYFDPNEEYIVLVGFGIKQLNLSYDGLVKEEYQFLTNVTYLYYSEAEGTNSWHFNANGYPTTIY